MNDTERTAALDELVERAMSEMVARGLVVNREAAIRATVITGLHRTVETFSGDELRQHLERFGNFCEHEAAR